MKVHLVGVGGVGMGSLAVALASSGHVVTGSDGKLYEPMKGVLERASIRLMEGFTLQNLAQVNPDVVVIGNVVRKENPEASAWIRGEARFISFPQAVREFVIQDKYSIVVTGTHGKTTTTTWIAFLLKELGVNPSYLIGGVPVDLPQGCVVTESPYFVGEGDEYDSAFFDKGPKFLHYNPHFGVISSIEFDHADIYRDLDHVKASFEKLVALLPGDGLCVARFEDSVVMEVVTQSLCPVQTFGLLPGAMWRIGKVVESEQGLEFEVLYKGRSLGLFKSPLMGEHNLANLLSGIVCATNLGHSIEKIRPIVERFHSVKRRQEILLKEPVTIVDDFAHHPTEVRATLKAVRKRFPKGKVWALFEPRSATARRNVHQEEYAKAFDSADQILVKSPYRMEELSKDQSFSTDSLVTSLNTNQKRAFSFDTVDEIVSHVFRGLSPQDVIVVMSNGEFDKIQLKLLERAKLGI